MADGFGLFPGAVLALGHSKSSQCTPRVLSLRWTLSAQGSAACCVTLAGSPAPLGLSFSSREKAVSGV